MSKKPLMITFDKDGNMCDHAHSYYQSSTEEAKDFNDCLEYVEMHDGHKRTARAHFRSVNTGRKYSLMLRDFHDIIVNRKFVDNKVDGRWTFRKHGNAQSIKLIKE